MSNSRNKERKMGKWYTEKVEFFAGVILIVAASGLGMVIGQ
jgi:hypothetical protein